MYCKESATRAAIWWDEMDEEIPKALNTLARHQMITRLEVDILADMQVCEIEGWDQMEYLNELKEVIDGFIERGKGLHGDAGGVGKDQGSRDSPIRIHLDMQ